MTVQQSFSAVTNPLTGRYFKGCYQRIQEDETNYRGKRCKKVYIKVIFTSTWTLWMITVAELNRKSSRCIGTSQVTLNPAVVHYKNGEEVKRKSCLSFARITTRCKLCLCYFERTSQLCSLLDGFPYVSVSQQNHIQCGCSSQRAIRLSIFLELYGDWTW